MTVNMEGAGQDYTDGFIGDGFHPGTIVQGLITQAVVNKINALEGEQAVTPVTDADIVNYAEAAQPTIVFSSSAQHDDIRPGDQLQGGRHASDERRRHPWPGQCHLRRSFPRPRQEPAHPGVVLGTVPLNPAGTATLTVKDLPSGSYSIAAIYNGDRNTDARLSTTLTQTVSTTPAATSTMLYTSANPTSPDVPVTFTAIVNAQGSGLPSPSGFVTFRDQSTHQVLGTAPVNGQGIATLSAGFDESGSHVIVASYDGAPLLAGSMSTPLVEMVNDPIPPNLATTTRVITAQIRGGSHGLGQSQSLGVAGGSCGGPPEWFRQAQPRDVSRREAAFAFRLGAVQRPARGRRASLRFRVLRG